MGVFFFCMFMAEMESRSTNMQKRGQYLAILTEQAWSIKDLLYGKRSLFSCRTQQVHVIVNGQDTCSSILPLWVMNHNAGFCKLILSAHGASHVISNNFNIFVAVFYTEFTSIYSVVLRVIYVQLYHSIIDANVMFCCYLAVHQTFEP